MTSDEFAWLAGVVDAEGSFSMSYQTVRRHRYVTTVRKIRARIKTTDPVLIPYIASLLDHSYSKLNNVYEITFYGRDLVQLIINILPFLYVKRRHAEICLAAMKIKNGQNSPYTKQESEAWNNCMTELSKLNERGRSASTGYEVIDHHFHYAWLAGLIDGDGSISTARFNSNNKKPFIKISLTNHNCIEYIANKLYLSVGGCSGKGDRRPTRQVRLMSTAITEFAPKILPYLILKHAQTQLALKLVLLRKDNVGNKIDPRVPELLDSISFLNNYRPHELIYKDNKLFMIYDINNRFPINIVPDYMIFSDEISKNPQLFNGLINHKLGNNKPPYRIRPQQCEVRMIDNTKTKDLYDSHHYQGHINARFNLGVYYNNKLVACLSISKPTRQSSGDWEISRMVCDSSYRVYGLWSYLMSYVIKTVSGKLVTFSDDRVMDGSVYMKMGFVKSGLVRPDYYWVKNNERFHKSGLRKNAIERESDQTEVQLRTNQGYHRVFDLGKTKWELFIRG